MAKRKRGIPNTRRCSSNWEYLIITVIYTVYQSLHFDTAGISVGKKLEPVLLSICILLICIPIQYMQIAIGQYSQSSAIKLRHMSPISEGIAYTFILLTFLRLTYETILASDAFLYLLNTMQMVLPWLDCTKCPGEDSVRQCWDGDPITCENTPCLNSITDLAASCYWNETFMQYVPATSITTFPDVRRFVITLVFWMVIYSITYHNKKKLCKPYLRHLFAISIYLRVIVFIPLAYVNTKMTQGFHDSLSTTVQSLQDVYQWSRTLMFSIAYFSLGRGGLIILGSFLSPKSPSGVMTVCSAVLSYLCYELIIGVHFTATAVIVQHSGLSQSREVILRNLYEDTRFTLIPAGFAYTKLKHFWTMLYFLSIGFHAIVHVTLNLRILELTLEDNFRSFVKYRKYILMGAFIAHISISLIIVTRGLYKYSNTYLICGLDLGEVIITLIFVITVGWIYGFQRLSDDIHFIVGSQPTKFWKVVWCLCPVVITIAMVLHLSGNSFEISRNQGPWIFVTVLQLVFLSPVVILGGRQMWKYIKGRKLLGLFQPTEEWGPQDKEELQLRRVFNPRKETKSWRRNDACKHKCLLKSGVLARVIIEENRMHLKKENDKSKTRELVDVEKTHGRVRFSLVENNDFP